jgi:hypothetical protein
MGLVWLSDLGEAYSLGVAGRAAVPNTVYTGGGMATTENLRALERVVGTDQGGVGDCPHTAQSHRNASLIDRLWASKFPCRWPKLYGLLLELRNFAHRIQRLRMQKDIRYVDIGPVYQPSGVPGFLLKNIRTQSRSEGIRKLHDEFPWLTTDDFAVFLLGWDAAEEWCGRPRDCDTVDSVACSQA